MNRDQVFAALAIEDSNPGVFAGGWIEPTGEVLDSINPTTEESLGSVTQASLGDYEAVVASATDTFAEWRLLPAEAWRIREAVRRRAS